jgi:phosphate:Na+ symporter
VLLAAVDVEFLARLTLGLIGLALLCGLDRADRARHTLFALLGLALLVTGLSMVKGAAGDVSANPWVKEFLVFSGSETAVAFLVGFVLAITLQSSSVVTVLTLPLVGSGLVALDPTVAMIYGACVGSGASVFLLSAGLEGAMRQLALGQAIIRGLTGLLLVTLFELEQHADLPLVLSALRLASASPAMQASLAYLSFQLVFALTSTLLRQPLLRLVAYLAPVSQTELLMKPQFVFEGAAADPQTALSLSDLEHRRLLGHLPDYLDELRDPGERTATYAPLALRHQASTGIAQAIELLLGETLRNNPETNPEPLFRMRGRIAALQSLQQALAEFTGQLLALPRAEQPAFAKNMVEGLHALLSFAAEAMGENSADARELMMTLTEERSGLMEQTRQELLRGEGALQGPVQVREALLSAILVFERIVWMLRRLIPQAAPVPGP